MKIDETMIQFINWDKVVKEKKLDEEFIEAHYDYLDKGLLVKHQRLSIEFIVNHLDDFNMKHLILFQNLTYDFIENHCKRVYLQDVIIHQKVSDDFLIQNLEKFEGYGLRILITNIRGLSEKILDMVDDFSSFNLAIEFQELSPEYIKSKYPLLSKQTENDRCIIWNNLLTNQKLTPELIKDSGLPLSKYIEYQQHLELDDALKLGLLLDVAARHYYLPNKLFKSESIPLKTKIKYQCFGRRNDLMEEVGISQKIIEILNRTHSFRNIKDDDVRYMTRKKMGYQSFNWFNVSELYYCGDNTLADKIWQEIFAEQLELYI